MSRRHPVRACAVASAAVSFVFLSGSFAYAQLFQPPTFQSSGVEGQVLTASLADLNRDGRQDMVVSLRPTATDPVAFAVFYSTPEGFTHVATVNFPIAGTTMTRMTLADLDRDGQQDLVAAASDQVAVFWGSGDAGVFGSVPTMIAGFFGVRDVAVADFNGDGRGDLAVADTNGSTTVWVVPGADGRRFGTPVGLLDGGVARPMDIAVGDVDADGRIDVVGVSSPSTITVVRNQGAFQFAPAVANVVLASPSTLASSLAVADVNGDGKADATAFDGGSALVTALSVGDGSLTVAGRQNIPNPFSAELTIDDLNGDGAADLLIGATNGGQVAILLGHGDGTFGAATLLSSGGHHDLTTGDVNGDGARDIVGVSNGVITVALHVTPLTVAISASAGTAGADGFAAVTATASSGDYTGVSFTWFVDGNPLASGATTTARLAAGVHVLLVRAVTSTGLHASASTTLSIAGAPASQTSVNTIQQTLDARLDTAVSTRASQTSVTALNEGVSGLATRLVALESHLTDVATQTTLASIGTVVTSALDQPVSSRASAADVAAIGAKIDRLQAALPPAVSTAEIKDAIAALGASLQASALRIAIEQALGRVEMVASFYLPTANGGQLDLVRTTVADVIDRSDAAGGNASNVLRARKGLSDGDARKAAGDYRGAYLFYAGAYNALAFVVSK